MGKHLQLYKQACALLNVDPQKIRCVGPAEFKRIAGIGVGRNLGRANSGSFRIDGERIVYVSRKASFSTFVHELLHHLFPSRPHWWIFAAAWELADTPRGYRGRWYGYGKSLHAEPRQIESKEVLVQRAHKAAKRLRVVQNHLGQAEQNGR